MNTRKNSFGLSGALFLTTAILSFHSPAIAQGPAAAAPDETEAETTTAPADPTLDASLGADESGVVDTTTEASEPAPPVEAEPEPEVQPTPVEESASEKVETQASPDTKKEPDNGWGIDQLSIVQTPWTAYPSQYVRGITYGSLWRTFHGQQWPYMPNAEGQENKTLQIGLSGYIWNDLSNTRIATDDSISVNDQNRWMTQTRGLLRVTPTLNVGKGWFVQGNAELVVQGDMRPDSTGVLATTDDLWIRFGKWNLFDITVGRFQGWEIANHYGLALDWATLERQGAWIVNSSLDKPTDGYGLDYFWDRQNFLLGGYALHVYPTKWLRGELLGHVGAGNSSNASNPHQFDIRPSVIFDIGYLKLKAGYEYGKATPQDKTLRMGDTKNGFGAAAQVVLAPYVEFGGSFARGYQDILDENGDPHLARSNTAQSFGGFINVSPGWEPLVIGAGAYLKSYKNFRVDASTGPHQGEVDTNDQWLFFGTAQYNLWRQLYLKLVVSHASNKVENSTAGIYVNNALSTRFRVEYLF